MYLYNKDILYTIKSFLTNYDIIELLVSSKNIKNLLGKKNLFTSIYINYNMNISEYIRHYIDNKRSINTVIINRIKNPILYWPFDINIMIFIDCDIDKEYIDNNYKTKNGIIINTRYKYN
jgi:hypothetical protein